MMSHVLLDIYVTCIVTGVTCIVYIIKGLAVFEHLHALSEDQHQLVKCFDPIMVIHAGNEIKCY